MIPTRVCESRNGMLEASKAAIHFAYYPCTISCSIFEAQINEYFNDLTIHILFWFWIPIWCDDCELILLVRQISMIIFHICLKSIHIDPSSIDVANPPIVSINCSNIWYVFNTTKIISFESKYDQIFWNHFLFKTNNQLTKNLNNHKYLRISDECKIYYNDQNNIDNINYDLQQRQQQIIINWPKIIANNSKCDLNAMRLLIIAIAATA